MKKWFIFLKKKKKKEGDGGDKSAARGVIIYGFHTRKKQTAHKHLITLKDGVVIYTLL